MYDFFVRVFFYFFLSFYYFSYVLVIVVHLFMVLLFISRFPSTKLIHMLYFCLVIFPLEKISSVFTTNVKSYVSYISFTYPFSPSPASSPATLHSPASLPISLSFPASIIAVHPLSSPCLSLYNPQASPQVPLIFLSLHHRNNPPFPPFPSPSHSSLTTSFVFIPTCFYPPLFL